MTYDLNLTYVVRAMLAKPCLTLSWYQRLADYSRQNLGVTDRLIPSADSRRGNHKESPEAVPLLI